MWRVINLSAVIGGKFNLKNPLQDLLSSLNAVISTNEGTEFITGHVIYNPAYTYKFQLKTIIEVCYGSFFLNMQLNIFATSKHLPKHKLKFSATFASQNTVTRNINYARTIKNWKSQKLH